MRIRVPKRPAFTAGLALAVLATCSYYVFTLRHSMETRTRPGAFHIDSAKAQQWADPQVLLAAADHFYFLNNGPAALPLYARAEKLFLERGDARDELHAKVGRLRSEAETMSFVDLSRFLNEQLQNPIVQTDKRLRLWCLIAKGYTDIEIDYRATKRDWLEAQEIANELGENQWATRASGELGLIAFLEGNPGRAARLLGNALLSTMTSGDTGGQIRFLELIGRGFEEVNRHTEALRFFERAIKLADADKDSGLPFMAYEGKAQSLVALGKPDEAKTVLEDALNKARLQQKRGHEAQLLILLGKLASQTGDRKQAIADLEDAAQFSKRVQFFRMEADAMFELATLYRDAGDLPTAEERATDGLNASQRVGDRYYVPRNLTILADLKARRGRVSEANAIYEQAEDVIESMLISVDEPYWNSSVAASMSQTYLQHFELVIKSGDVPGAFHVLERVRGRTLAWALEDRKAFPTAESGQMASLETDLAGLQIQLMQTNSTAKREQLMGQLVEYERRLGLAWTKEDAPGHGLPVQPAPLSKVQKVLKPDEVLLEYVLDDPTSFCVVVSEKGAYVRALPAGRKEIENLSQQFVSEIRTKGTGAELSKRLYAMLVKPVPEAATATRFIIAPDAILNLLPFEALRDAQGEYLLKSRVISYVPSGTILNMLRHAEKPKPAPKSLLAVGDVEYENQGGAGRRIPRPASIRGRIERGIADLSGIGLHDLPETRAEVEEIGKIVGSDAVMLLGKDATETGFKKQPLDQFRILHLAVHGFADTQYPERSALVLGTDPQSGDDGLLQVREIIRLRLNAELTTLSACDSGVGKLQGQEGISNLVEAFLVAGSKSVVASLWSADDTFASALMEQFYRHLAQGEDTSSALRNAKVDLLAKYGNQVSPFYWAAFIAVGETSTPIGIKPQ
ncbi:MAG: CHAT domain-containing protein [Acidobacteriia bacterium]|nr:CHAT domain-containing protein [Terriglobia bacterium]